MSIIISESTKSKRELIPSGTHIARCYSMIHIGTQEFEYQGEKKNSNKIRLSFEMPHETRTFDGTEKPLSIQKEYTLSLHEKSNLRKDLESWRGKSFTAKELSNFDITNLIGAACNISIIHKQSNSGKQFAFISNISKLTKGVECPAQFNDSFEFNFTDKFNKDWLDNICPAWIKEQIENSDEFKNTLLETLDFDIETDNIDDDIF